MVNPNEPFRQVLADVMNGRDEKDIPGAVICAPFDHGQGRDESSTRVKEWLRRYKFSQNVSEPGPGQVVEAPFFGLTSLYVCK
jgi:hypothetical protein